MLTLAPKNIFAIFGQCLKEFYVIIVSEVGKLFLHRATE